MQNQQACVWATSRDRWDSFLNDPELAQAIESARNDESAQEASESPDESVPPAETDCDESEKEHRIVERIRAYETPITDEILRQSIR